MALLRRLKPRPPYRINLNSSQASGLLGWMPFQPVFGETSIGYGLLAGGIDNGGLTYRPDPDGSMGVVPVFDNTDDYINFPGVHFPTPVTIPAWIRIENPSTSHIICGEWDNPGNTWLIYFWALGGGRISLNDGVSDTYFDYPAALAGEWHHIVVESTGQGYLDGEEQSMTGTSSTWSSTSNDFQIGKWSGNFYQGMIGDLRVYSRALGAARVRSLYDPKTRWDLYAPIGRTRSVKAGAAPTSIMMSGSVTPTGALALALSVSRSFSGSVTPTGVLTTSAPDVVAAGTVTPTGALVKSASIGLAGAVAPAGDLFIARLLALTGGVLPSGALALTPMRLLSGVIAPAGALRRSPAISLAGAVTSYGGLSVGVGEAPCTATLAELRARLWAMLDDDGTYYAVGQVDYALNRAERLFLFLTLAYEKTVSFSLVNGQYFYNISDQISDFICPLRVSHSGVRLRPDTLHEMDSRSSGWRAATGNPVRYAQHGFDTLFIAPHPVSGVHTLDFTYAAMPPVMVAPTDAPSLPGEQQSALLDIAYYLLRLPEGSAELQAAVVYFKRGIEQASKYASFIRSKSRGQIYDRLPFDLQSYDKGRFDVVIKQARAMRKKQEGMAK